MANPFYNYENDGLSPISEGDFSPAFSEMEEFTLIKSIGRGSFAEVFLGIENGTGRQYAIKVRAEKKQFNRKIAFFFKK